MFGRKNVQTKNSSDEKMYRRKNAQTKKCMDEKMHRRKYVQTKKYTDEKTHRRKNAQTKKCIDEKMHRRKYVQTKKCTDENLRTKICRRKIVGRISARRKTVMESKIILVIFIFLYYRKETNWSHHLLVWFVHGRYTADRNTVDRNRFVDQADQNILLGPRR